MDWHNYLSEEKSPVKGYAHLGVLEGTVSGIYDLATIPKNTKVLNLGTPLKKWKLSYTNWDSLKNNSTIEAIIISDVDKDRLAVFATLPNLKY